MTETIEDLFPDPIAKDVDGNDIYMWNKVVPLGETEPLQVHGGGGPDNKVTAGYREFFGHEVRLYTE